MIPGEWSTMDTIGLALMCAGVGLLLLVCVHIASGGARPGREEWRHGAVKHHAWQPRHDGQPRQVDSPPQGPSILDCLELIWLAQQIQQWPEQDRHQAELVRPYVPGRHTAAEQVAA